MVIEIRIIVNQMDRQKLLNFIFMSSKLIPWSKLKADRLSAGMDQGGTPS
jgi:hypothetical protein